MPTLLGRATFPLLGNSRIHLKGQFGDLVSSATSAATTAANAAAVAKYIG